MSTEMYGDSPIVILVRSGDGTVRHTGVNEHGVDMNTFTDVVDTIERVPREHDPQHGSRWWSTTYKGKRYVVLGGVRTDHFISLRSPIQGRNGRRS